MSKQEADSDSEELTGEAGGADTAATVLVVDDDPALVAALQMLLEGAGYQVLTAGNGHEALTIFSEQADDIDLILLDLVMPGMGGKKCLDCLLKLDPEARILMTTGYYLRLFREEAYEDMKPKVKGFVPKPCDPTVLLDLVAHAVQD